MKNISASSSSLIYFFGLILSPLLIIIFSGHFFEYVQSFFIGAIFCIIFRFPFFLYCAAYFWACSISIFIANWHINLTSEPYIVNLEGGGSDDKTWALRALKPSSEKFIEPYAKFLNVLARPVFNFYKPTFYSLISVNCIFHGLGSSALFKIIRILNYGNYAERFSYFSYLFFPFIAYNGLTLMRDGTIASLLIITIALVISNNNLISYRAIISFLALSFLRISSGLLLILSTFITWSLTIKNFKITLKGLLTIFLLIIGIFLFSEKVISYLLYKEVFVDFFIRSQAEELLIMIPADDLINRLIALPNGIKQLALFLYYLLAPLASPMQIFSKDSGQFFYALFSIWNIFSIKLCMQDFFYQIKNYKYLENRDYFRLLIFFIIFIYIIANYSVILRHKTFAIPIQIILTAHSLKRNKLFDYSFSWLFSLVYFFLTLA